MGLGLVLRARARVRARPLLAWLCVCVGTYKRCDAYGAMWRMAEGGLVMQDARGSRSAPRLPRIETEARAETGISYSGGQ